MQRSRWAFIDRSCSAETVCILIRLEWKENRSAVCRASSAGTSVSTVTLELGTTSPMRCGVTGFLLRLRRACRRRAEAVRRPAVWCSRRLPGKADQVRAAADQPCGHVIAQPGRGVYDDEAAGLGPHPLG